MAYKKHFDRYASPKKKYKEKHKAYKRKDGKEGYQTRKYKEKVNPDKSKNIEQAKPQVIYSNWDKPIEIKPFPKPKRWWDNLPDVFTVDSM